jgi:hypothetical protein
MTSVRRLAALAVVMAGCAGSSDGGDFVDALPHFTIDEELRIGSVDDPDVGFSSITAVTVDQAGRVFVLERQEMAVRIYDDDGILQTKLGSRGEGPGEFQFPSAMGLIADTLWVSDVMLRRVSLFTPDDGFIYSFPMTTVEIETVPGLAARLVSQDPRPDGLLNTTWMIPVLREMPDDSFWLPHARMDRDGTVIDTIQLQRYGFAQRERVDVGGRTLSVPSGPSSHPLFIDAGDDAYVIERPVATSADAAEFTITRIAGIADTLFHDTLGYRPRPFDATAIDSVIAAAVASYRQRNDPDADAIAAAFRAGFSPPAFHPPIGSGRVGEDGTLWLERHDAGGPVIEWLLVAADGEPRGILELDRGTVVHWSDASILWAVARDEFDVPWLVKYRLRPASPD